jgi:nucleoside-diphosphate-sugar epimerase
MDKPIVIFGYGATGRATAAALLARGTKIRIAQRTRPKDLPPQAEFVSCDVLDQESVLAAAAGAAQIVFAVGFAYDARIWQNSWPRAMTNLVNACAVTGARAVFIDNLYMYGPQTTPLHEDMPLTTHGAKPPVRAAITRIWQAAAAAGKIRFTALRAPDFYGPGVTLSHLGPAVFERLARKKSAIFLHSPDQPHDFAYVPDIARAAVTLLDAPDDVFGQVWHVPCAATRTPRDLIALGAQTLGAKPKILSAPPKLLPAFGLFSPFLREVADMGFTWDRPYQVNAQKFQTRFWPDATPFETGIPATARSFLPAETLLQCNELPMLPNGGPPT